MAPHHIMTINSLSILLYCFYYQMSNSKRSSYFYSPLTVECDQKDLIISHLKEEIYLLRRNQQELGKLDDQYRGLEYRFRTLSEEKIQIDAEFRDRHELALRTISQLKNEIDAFRADLREKNLQIDDLQSDENTLIGQLDQRIIEIDRLKNQLNSMLADNEQLLNQRLRTEQTSSGVRKDNELLTSNCRDLQMNNDNVKRKIDDLQKYIDQLKGQENALKDKIISYENSNNQMDADLTRTIQDCGELDNQISNAQNELSKLHGDIAEAAALAEKYKSQAIHYQKATQTEVMRNNDLTKGLNHAQNTLRLRVNQVAEGNRQVAGLNAQNQKLGGLNGNLRDDIEYCRKHLQNLSLLNSDLVINLERYSEEDDIVRNLIDRKARVIKVKSRVEDAGVLLARTNNTVELSTRKSKLTY